jgi:hypothetical protein
VEQTKFTTQGTSANVHMDLEEPEITQILLANK